MTSQLLVLLLYCLAGTLAGIVTGMVPGLHVNLAVFLILGASIESKLGGEPLTVFVIGMAVSHNFVGFIPAVFLRAPSAETALALHPADRLLQSGRGVKGVVAAQTGALYATLMVALASVALFLCAPQLLPLVERGLRPVLGYLLLLVLGWFVIREIDFADLSARRFGRVALRVTSTLLLLALLAQLSDIALSGILVSSEQGIMSSFTGMFAGAMLLLPASAAWSVSAARSTVPQQRQTHGISLRDAGFTSVAGAAGGGMVGLLPGVGAGEVGAVAAAMSERIKTRPGSSLDRDERFLVLMGAIGAADTLLAISAIFLVGKARSGASIGVEHLLGDQIASASDATNELLLERLIAAAVIAALLAFWMGRRITNWTGALYGRLHGGAISFGTLASLVAFVGISGGMHGFLLFLAAVSVGFYALAMRIRPATLMGFLIIPACSFFLGQPLPLLPVAPVGEMTLHPRPGIEQSLLALGGAAMLGALGYGLVSWVSRKRLNR